MTLIPLRNILAQNARQAGISQQILAAQVIEKCNEILVEIFGPGIARKSRAMYLRGKVLTVGCLSSVMTQEIYLKRTKIIKELNRRLGGEVVTDLKFKM
jgi:predicted nucleic acid-binding Zn ribbon protein